MVVNPRALATGAGATWPEAVRALAEGATIAGELETRADGANVPRIAALLADARPDVAVAAGGDGTLAEVAAAVRRVDPTRRPAVGILPLGTANNVARALGLATIRRDADAALRLALGAILGGRARALDLGEVNGHVFVGSLAVGMDADILALRNRLRRRLRLGGGLGGYPLYLASCAASLLGGGHGARADLRIDERVRSCRAYDLLVLNTPLYAGEFRFDAGAHDDDGRLDLHVFEGPAPYVQGFVRAWRRHLRFARGEPVEAPAGVTRAAAIVVELARPVAAQLDGEEHPAAARYEIRVLPRALRVHVPAA